jgi:hypothetical protein
MAQIAYTIEKAKPVKTPICRSDRCNSALTGWTRIARTLRSMQLSRKMTQSKPSVYHDRQLARSGSDSCNSLRRVPVVQIPPLAEEADSARVQGQLGAAPEARHVERDLADSLKWHLGREQGFELGLLLFERD